MTEIPELLELAKRCEDRALYNTSGDPMKLLKEAAEVMRRHARGCLHAVMGVAQDVRDRDELRTLIIAAIDRNLGDGIPGTKEAADAILSLVSRPHHGATE